MCINIGKCLFFLIFTVDVESTINPFGPTVVNDFTSCIQQVMEMDFNKLGLLIFANTKNVSTPVARIRVELLKYVHNNLKYSIQISHPGNEIPICGKHETDNNVLHYDHFETVPIAEYFLIIIDKYEHFDYVTSKLIRSRSWNPLAKFVVLLFNFVSSDRKNVEYVENMLSCLFKFNVVNIVIIVPQANKIRNAFVYGWRPYDPPKYCGYANETAKNRLRIENICYKGILKHKTSLFDGRISWNMQGCTLNILALERQPFISSDVNDPNIEKILMNEVIKSYKLKTNYKILSAFRGQRDSGDWDGALRELVAKKGDILVGGIFPDFDVHEDFECSSAYLADSYTWVVPRAFQSPPWVALIIIFKKNVWLTVISMFIVCAVAWWVLGQLSKDSTYSQSFDHCFLGTWICTLGFCTYSRPSTKSLRLFFVFLNLYCILCITAYQTKLIDVLRNPTFEYQIKNVQELVMSGLKFGGSEELHDVFYNSSDAFDNYIGEHWIDVDNIDEAILDVAVHRNFSLLCSRLQLSHLSAVIPELSDEFGNHKYYAFEMNVFSVPMEMVALKGYPFMREFSDTLGLLKQLGFNAWLRNEFYSFNMRRKAKLLRALGTKSSEIDSFSMQHLQGGFLALILGFTLGTFVLLAEITFKSKFVKHQIERLGELFTKC